MKLLNKSTLVRVKADVLSIAHLPVIDRIIHAKARRTVLVVASGVILMVVGSFIASHRHELSEMFPVVNHLLFDVFGYFIHACGALPALRYVEPLWTLLMGAEPEIIAAV